MGLGVAAPGPNVRGAAPPFRSLAEYRGLMREIVQQGLVDIMLMSPSSCEVLACDEGIFEQSKVTPAGRANDATDIWLGQSGNYTSQPSRNFFTAMIPEIQFGSNNPAAARARVDLGLYSVTLNNDAELDRSALESFREFRDRASAAGFRYFLEVFAPNASVHRITDVPRFVNDSIVRMLAGVVKARLPLFLKMPYFGPAPLEALCHYDSSLVVGVLGGSAGTSHDAFRLVEQSKKYGARAALFGRKINHAEDQLSFVRLLRAVADDQIAPDEAVRAYHAELKRNGLRPNRSLSEDLVLTDPTLS